VVDSAAVVVDSVAMEHSSSNVTTSVSLQATS